MSSEALQEYVELLRAELARLQPQLREELARILGFQFHPEVDLLHFEFFDDAICQELFPFFLYAQRRMDGPQNYSLPFWTARKVFEAPEGSGDFPGIMNLLGNHRSPIMDPETWERYAEATDEERIRPIMVAESDIVHDWFVSNWIEVGGPGIPINTYLIRVYAPQNDEGFDLRRLIPVKWADIWK